MIGYKERKITMEAASTVYFHYRKKCFSLQQNGLVVLHAPTVVLKDVTFTVSEKLRQKVIASGVKNVHAKVHGTLSQLTAGSLEGYREAWYRPQAVSTFVDRETMQPLTECKEIILTNCKMYYK